MTHLFCRFTQVSVLLLLVFAQAIAFPTKPTRPTRDKGRPVSARPDAPGVPRKADPTYFRLQKGGHGTTLMPVETPSVKQIKALGSDPIIFRLLSTKKVVKVGEEVTLTITAEAFDTHAGGIFIFDEWRGYSLKVLMPVGFVQTGGTYYDLITGRLDYPANPRAEYTLVGRFTTPADSACFTLIRGSIHPKTGDLFVKKGTVCLSSTYADEVPVTKTDSLAQSTPTKQARIGSINSRNCGNEVKPTVKWAGPGNVTSFNYCIGERSTQVTWQASGTDGNTFKYNWYKVGNQNAILNEN